MPQRARPLDGGPTHQARSPAHGTPSQVSRGRGAAHEDGRGEVERQNQDQDGEKGHFISTEEAVLQGNDLFISTKDPEFGASSQQCLGKECLDCCLAMWT